MATITKIIGLQKLQNKLNRLPSVAKDLIKQALEQSAAEIVAMAKSLVPVDDGDLRDSIGWTYGKAPKGAMTLGKVAASELAGDLTITIYAGNSKAYYARWVEFGTNPHKIEAKHAKSLGKDGRLGTEVDHPGSAKSPFFYPSYRANKKQAKRRINKALRGAAKKVAAQ
ncbi:HK97 gp10 family phage protein [Paraburkholderia aspalathi]|nr:HK97 gp10 family phage protein [Paraburkholderia aspalathi]